MAIGLAFVDIVGDTSRTEQQIERDMNRVIVAVDDAIDSVDIRAVVDSHTEQQLTSELNRDIRAAQAAISAVNVDARLDPETRRRLTDNLKEAIAQARARADEIKVRVDQRAVVAEVVTAVEVAQAAAPTVEIETRVDNDRLGRTTKAISGIGAAALPSAQSVGLLVGSFAGLPSAVRLLGGVVTALGQIAPAAALAVPAVTAIGLSIGTIKLATSGISDAVKAAFDPSNPDKFRKSLENLAPNAQEFVLALHRMQPALKDLQLGIQQRFFEGFAGTLRDLSDAVLPSVVANLFDVARTFHIMAVGAADAAGNLAKSGVLGTALDSAAAGLRNFTNLPGLAVTALGQIGAAAGPAFDRLTAAADKSLTGIADHLSTAFATGALQHSIETAVTELGKLLDVARNIGTIFSNIGAQAGGFTSIIDVLKAVTGEIAKFTGTKAAQDAFKALFDAADLLAATALPLLGQALSALAPVIGALKPGFEALVNALGPALSQVIAALGPVLVAAAQAVSQIVVAVAPLITLLGQLISAVLPALTPLLDLVTTIFAQLSPIIAQVASILASVLIPVITTIVTSVLPPFVQIFSTLITNLLPILGQLITALAPALLSLGQSFAQIAVAVAPVLVAFGQLLSTFLPIFVPLLTPIIQLVGQLATIFAGQLAAVITNIVVPALTLVADVLSGNFTGAFQASRDLVKGIIREIVIIFVTLPVQIIDALVSLGSSLLRVFGDALNSLENLFVQKFPEVINFFLELPGDISRGVGDLGRLLTDAGRAAIDGLIEGIRSGIDELGNVLDSITGFIQEHKGPPQFDRVMLTPAGESIMAGLVAGISNGLPGLAAQLGIVNDVIGGSVTGGPASFGAGGRPVSASAASVLTSPSAAPTAGPGVGPVNVSVMLGTEQITDILDVRIAAANRVTGRSIINGARA